MSLIARRSFLFGAIAAPAIVRASSLMVISPVRLPALPAAIDIFSDEFYEWGATPPSLVWLIAKQRSQIEELKRRGNPYLLAG